MMVPIFTAYVSILLGIFLFGCGLWLYFGNRTRPQDVTMSALLVCAGLWSFAYVLWCVSEDPSPQVFWLKTLVFLGLMLPVLFLFHAVSYFKGQMPSLYLQATAFLPNMVAFWIIFGSDRAVRLAADGSAVFGSAGVVLAMHFGIVYAIALSVLFIVARKKRNEDRRAMLIAFGGSILAFNSVFAVLAGAAMSHDLHYIRFGGVVLSVGMLITASPILKRVLFRDLRLLGAGLFVLISLALIVTDIVVSVTLVDFTFRLTLMIIVMSYGILILRSHLREVHRLQTIEEMNGNIARLNRALVKSDRMKTRFLSFASHQMRAPLTGVMSYLGMMRRGEFGKISRKQEEVLELNEDAVKRLRSTIETFLDISKIEMGGLDLERSETNVGNIVVEVMQELGPSAKKKGLRLKLETVGAPPPVMADSGKLYHAIINLIDNALKFTDKGGVTVTVSDGRGRVKVEVRDTGRGMEAATIAKIRRILADGLEQVRFEREGGSGLGIYISKRIVEGHGGKLTAKSRGKGKGSMFSFWLPKV